MDGLLAYLAWHKELARRTCEDTDVAPAAQLRVGSDELPDTLALGLRRVELDGDFL